LGRRSHALILEKLAIPGVFSLTLAEIKPGLNVNFYKTTPSISSVRINGRSAALYEGMEIGRSTEPKIDVTVIGADGYVSVRLNDGPILAKARIFSDDDYPQIHGQTRGVPLGNLGLK